VKLYFSRNYNPRLAVATAKYLRAPVEFEFAAPIDFPEKFRALNPNLRVPILVDGDRTLWEADAIACRLSQLMGSEFWRTGEAQPDMIRWLSWGVWGFVRGCDRVHFERVTKQRYGIGPIDEKMVAEGLAEFAETASLLNGHFSSANWLLGDVISYADFRMACVLPFADLAGLPLREFPNVQRWYDGLEALPAWRDPFAGLAAPLLPEVPTRTP
jgi:glutathione S-transferase